jgi:gas vesicle protein
MAKKSFIFGSIVGAGLTALSIILLAPQDGNDLKDEIEFEIEDIKEKVTHQHASENDNIEEDNQTN